MSKFVLASYGPILNLTDWNAQVGQIVGAGMSPTEAAKFNNDWGGKLAIPAFWGNSFLKAFHNGKAGAARRTNLIIKYNPHADSIFTSMQGTRFEPWWFARLISDKLVHVLYVRADRSALTLDLAGKGLKYGVKKAVTKAVKKVVDRVRT
jgi:hypothetical protein